MLRFGESERNSKRNVLCCKKEKPIKIWDNNIDNAVI